MKYRTDLAVEGIENLESSGVRPGEKDGIVMEKEKIDDDINAGKTLRQICDHGSCGDYR